MDKIQAIIEIIKNNWSTDELVKAWNLRCEKKGYMDELIEDMSFFDEMFQNVAMDISSDIQVLEVMLKQDGLTEDGIHADQKEPMLKL